MGETINIAIVSDMHCKSGPGSPTAPQKNTYLTSDLMPFPVNKNPIEALKKVIENEALVAEILICPGDITDQIDQQGLITGWKHLEDLKNAFRANMLAATVGNHDVDSRKRLGPDPFDLVKRVSQNFPTGDPNANMSYWAKHFCIVQSTNLDLLIFNSSYSHTDELSAKKSRITDAILAEMKLEIEKLVGNSRSKVAVCHHHPIKHSNMTYEDGDSIEKGEEFVKLLNHFGFKLVIHGHKHDPRLSYLDSVPVLACGAFSSMENLLDLGAENTFHFVQLNQTNKNGTIRTWIYRPKSGWTQKMDTYFPCFTGFGAKPELENLAKSCVQFLSSKAEDSLRYDELLENFPELQYLIPSEQEELERIISAHQFAFTPKLPNKPEWISKLYQ